MKKEVIFVIYNIIVIITFACIYYYLSEEHFYIEKNLVQNDKVSIFEYINLSITIQSTVGLPAIRAKTELSRIFVTVQQILMIFSIYIMIIIYSFN